MYAVIRSGGKQLRVEPGQMVVVEWRGKPVWIVRRTDQMLADLAVHEPEAFSAIVDKAKAALA